MIDIEKIREEIFNILEDRIMTKSIHTGQQIDDTVVELLQFLANEGMGFKEAVSSSDDVTKGFTVKLMRFKSLKDLM